MSRRITRSGTATGVMAVIAASAAVLSFNTLAEIGNAAGLFPRPWGGYVWAAAVDGFITLGFLNLVGKGRRAVFARVQIVLGFAASLVFQLAHARGIVWPVAVAAVPPVAVVLSIEAWHLTPREQTATPAPVGEEQEPPAAPPHVQEEKRASSITADQGEGFPTAPPPDLPPARPALPAPPRVAARSATLRAVTSRSTNGAEIVARVWREATPEERSLMTARSVAERTGLSLSYCGKQLARLRREEEDQAPEEASA